MRYGKNSLVSKIKTTIEWYFMQIIILNSFRLQKRRYEQSIMLFYAKTSYKNPMVSVFLVLGFVSLSPARGQDSGIPVSFRSFKDYYLLTDTPETVEKISCSHRNYPNSLSTNRGGWEKSNSEWANKAWV